MIAFDLLSKKPSRQEHAAGYAGALRPVPIKPVRLLGCTPVPGTRIRFNSTKTNPPPQSAIPINGTLAPLSGILSPLMSIADFLFTKRQQKVLAPLLLNPGRHYGVTELVLLSGSGRGAGQVLVQNLINAGLLRETRIANLRRIEVNTAFPLYSEIRSICLKSFGLIEVLRSELEPFKESLDCAFVFGSVAQGTDHADSDIDLMIVGTVPFAAINEALANAEQTIGRTIHAHLYTSDEWPELRKDKIIASIEAGCIAKIFGN